MPAMERAGFSVLGAEAAHGKPSPRNGLERPAAML
jgi:hypothetical protein